MRKKEVTTVQYLIFSMLSTSLMSNLKPAKHLKNSHFEKQKVNIAIEQSSQLLEDCQI